MVQQISISLSPKPLTPWTFFKKTSKPYMLHLIGITLVGILWAIDLSLRPYIIKTIIDRAGDNSSKDMLAALQAPMLFYLALSSISTLNLRIYDYLSLKFVPTYKNKIVRDLTSHVLGHSHAYFQGNFAGTLSNKINDVASGMKDLIYIFIDRFFSNSIAVVIAIITFWSVNPILALILVAWTFTFVSFTFFMSSRIHTMAFKTSEARSLFNGRVVDLLFNHLTIRLFSRTGYERKKLKEHAQENILGEQQLRWFLLFLNLAQGCSFVIMIAATLSFLVWGRIHNLVTIGDFALILSVTISIVDQLWGLSKDFSEFIEQLGRVSQGLNIISLPHEIQDKPGVVPILIKRGEICFKDVQFWYKGAKPLFNNLNLFIPAGQKVGLVGFSGSGKTSLINLILRLYDIHKGQITIDDQDISCVSLKSLRQQIAMIPQEPSLLNRTIYENILYGRLQATEGEVYEAALKAHAHEFILRLPEKYHTMVGERGSRLSGGQRQRITIARAFLKNAPILLMDEATAALDTISEGIIQKGLDQLMENRTTLVIAHRLSTLLSMDRLIVFDNGVIKEDGTHAELLALNGIYKRLWDKQVNGFIVE